MSCTFRSQVAWGSRCRLVPECNRPRRLSKEGARYAVRQLLASLLLCACGRSDGLTERHWTEDVLLGDDSTIVVERTVLLRETNSMSGDAYNAVESDATLSFTGSLANLPTWREPLTALVLYRDAEANEWVIVATTTSCDVWSQRGEPHVTYLPDEPDTLYWEYRLEPKGWREVSLPRTSVGRPVNILHRYQRDLDASHVTAEFRRVRQSDWRMAKELVNILERPQVNCTPSGEYPRPEEIEGENRGK